MGKNAAIRRTVGAVLLLGLIAPAAAGAGMRHTTPAATATAGDCSAALPCRIDHAINNAVAGDEVVVASGIYQVATPLDAEAIDLHGVSDQVPPLLIGDPGLTLALLSFKEGGTLRHLSLLGKAPGEDTLVLQKGLAEDLTIVSDAGDGAKVVTHPTATTILRDSVVRSESDGVGAAALKLRESSGSGSLAVLNVTALSTTQSAIRCEVSSGNQATLLNVIARGGIADVDASNGGEDCSASYSNLRPERSPGLALGAGIQSAEPQLAGDLRPLAGSPTVDAGSADPLLGTADPDGRPRTVPDIGAFECCGPATWPPLEEPEPSVEPVATPSPTPTPVPDKPAAVLEPVLGSSVVLAPADGRVRVRVPGAARFSPLAGAAMLPVGTVVDATRGRIRLTSALDREGTVQTGRFWGGRFQVRQSRDGGGMTSLALRGGEFGRCPGRARASGSSLARTSAVARENSTTRRVVRSLWARDRHGRFRTHGNNSVATARGTAWVTQDRCDGTVTRVREGAVLVRDRRTGRKVLVRAGRAYLAARR